MIIAVARQLRPSLAAGDRPARPAGPGGSLRAGPPIPRSLKRRFKFLAGFT